MTESTAFPVWFITGCSSGLGLALATRLLERGNRVVATARELASLTALRAAYPERCRTLALDVTSAEQVRTAVAEAAAAFGGIDVVVSNAGYGLVGAVEETPNGLISRLFETNFFGAVRVIQAVVPILRAQRRGHVVVVSAAAVISNYPGFSFYGASKAALESVAESLATEIRPFGLKVTIVQPGPFRTRFIAGSLATAIPPETAYEGSSGKFLSFLKSIDGKQAGDPAKAADAIIAAVEADRPPLRLVLGKYAIEKSRKRNAASERELETWAGVGLASDFEG